MKAAWPRNALGAVLAAPASALDPEKAITQYLHETWQGEQGLPQNSVWAITQAADGYLWLGTQEGLVRFDGVRFTVYDARTLPAIGHSDVQGVAVDSDGRIWAATMGGGLV